MTHPAHNDASLPAQAHGRHRAWGAALVMAALIGGFYLLREHWNHVAGGWPYLLLLVCPVMHLFHGHGGHGRHDSAGPRPSQE